MTLHQLRIFLAVAEARSVRAAAESLHISQPAVSGAVASLERELKVALLRPQGRGIRLTRAGETLAASVRGGVQQIDSGIRTAQSIDNPGSGSVRIASIASAAEQVVLPLLGEFRRRHPNADVTVQVGNRATVWQQLADFSVDLVVAGRPPDAAKTTILGQAPNNLVVVGSSDPDLGSVTWLLREEGSGTREAADELLDRLGIDPPRMILGSNGAVLQAISAGFGVGLLPAASLDSAHLAQGVGQLPCPYTPMQRPWHLVASSDEDLSPTVRLAVRSLLSDGNASRPTAAGSAFKPTAAGQRLIQTKQPS